MLSAASIPLTLINGEIFSFIPSFGLSSQTLSSHSAIVASLGRQSQGFLQLLELGRLREAWNVALQLQERKYYKLLQDRATYLLDLSIAELASRHLGDAATCLAIRSVVGTEDFNDLAAFSAILMSDVNKAIKLIEKASNRDEPLQLAIDLHQWERALQLASYSDPNKIPIICLNFAVELELQEKFERAITYFKKSS
ncbi:hypothetical protein GEMRC1_007985 [Eukaryota sp. GEM-RC1]